MHDDPTLTVVVPCYNAGPFIDRLLACFSRQDIREPWEILFVDNRSTDDTTKRIAEYGGDLPPFRVLEAKDKAGAGYARNVGVQHASSPFVAFCDADDEIPDDWAGKMCEGIRRFGFIGCRISDLDSNPEAFKGLMAGLAHGHYNLGLFPFCGAGTMGIGREIFMDVGGFDDALKICEDIDFCYRAQLLGNPLHEDLQNTIYYRVRNSEWALYKQRYTWGRHEKAIALRYKRFGHKQFSVEGGSVKQLLKSSIRFVLTPFNQGKRIQAGLKICKHLAALMPPIKEAALPVKIDENRLQGAENSRQPAVVWAGIAASRLNRESG